jgi:carboxyl-terminal processing protease
MPHNNKLTFLSLLLIISLLFSSVSCLPLVPGATAPGTGAQSDISVIEQAWSIIHDDYVDKSKLDDSKLTGAAIKAMVEAINDPYTSYFDAESYKLNLTSLEGSFEGIGATVTSTEDKKIQVVAPIKGSPAEKAGVKPGDIIVEINGLSTEGISLTEAIARIRGPKGTTVKLLMLHEGETVPVTIEVIRAKIDVPSVIFEMKGDIAYINLTQFSERTNVELSPVIDRLAAEGTTGIVLDMRGNPGGLLDTVVNVASHFIESGVVVETVDNRGNRDVLSVRRTGTFTSLPMVVLVDKYSASGSEVLAGALQDHKRAVVAGTKTFGKGSVNIFRQLKDGSGIYITTGRWLTPNGSLIEGKGIIPDYEIELTGDDGVNWAIDFLKSQKTVSEPELARV